ncbi:MAG: lysine transporter LysE [Actinobacteria bacterium HGW-Actinobacteria-4]|nr:MAG: lysine transporter LysE [Actinobacteria bacterium HGW-Actinobacteria-4]
MITTETLVAFAATAFLVIAIPGPSVLFVISRALEHGRRGALITAGANSAGATVGLLTVALGLGTLIGTSVAVFTGLKWAGAIFLVYLGAKAIRDRKKGLFPAADAAASSASQPTPASAGASGRPTVTEPLRTRVLVRQGFVVGMLNPKSALAMGAILPQFVDPTRGSAVAQMLMLGLVFTVIALSSDGTYAMLASALRQWFARSVTRIQHLRTAGGAMMMGLGVAMALSRR